MKWTMLVLVLASCDTDGTVSAEDVITSIVSSPSAMPADGVSTATVTVTTVSTHVKSGLTAKLTLHGASWLGTTDAAIQREFGPDGLLDATVVASRVTGTASVLVEVAGYERSAAITLDDAIPTELATTMSGRLESGKVSQIQLLVQPLVATGAPSAGTIVEFSLTTDPVDTGFLTTSKVVIDGSATTATATVVASSTTTGGSVDLKVTSPHARGTPVTKTLTFNLLP